MDCSAIVRNYRTLKKALPRFRIAYAIKANPHDRVISLLENEGSNFEIASVYELRFLLDRGIPPEQIVFSNPVKTIEDITEAVEAGVYLMAFDSRPELAKFIPFRSQIQPLFRIHVPNIDSIWPLSQKFGASRRFWPEIYEAMQNYNLPLSGITFHVGSQCEGLEAWHSAMHLTYEAIELSHDYGLDPSVLNIGGGFPIFLGRDIPKAAAIGAVVEEHLAAWEAKGFVPKDFFSSCYRLWLCFAYRWVRCLLKKTRVKIARCPPTESS